MVTAVNFGQPTKNTSDKARGFRVQVAASGTESTSIPCLGYSLVGFITPAELTSTAITFQASLDGITYVPIKNTSGTALSVTVAASGYYTLDPANFVGIPHLRLVCGSSEGDARDITCLVYEA
jgi:hypothetical protein